MKECIQTWVAAAVIAGVTIYIAAALSGCATQEKPAHRMEITTAKGEKL